MSSMRFIGSIVSTCVLLATAAHAQDFQRAGKFELFGVLGLVGGDSTTLDSGIANYELNHAYTVGAGFGYSPINELTLALSTFTGTINNTVSDSSGFVAEGDDVFWGVDLNLDWNILPTRITPVLGAGVGWAGYTTIFGDSAAGLSYNVGAGVRWDITNHFFMQGMCRLNWFDFDHQDDALQPGSFDLSMGWTF